MPFSRTVLGTRIKCPKTRNWLPDGMQQERLSADGVPVVKMRSYLKHFTAYSVETGRLSFSANVTAFDLFDSNLPQFEAALTQGNASGAMCSYFAPNGTSSCGSSMLLQELMRDRWARDDAVVMSDCGAVENMRTDNKPVEDKSAKVAVALNAGMDLYAGGGSDLFGDGHLLEAVQRGMVREASVTKAAARVLSQRFSLGLFDDSDPWSAIGAPDLNSTRSQQVAYEAALQGMVLLQNERGALPFATGTRIAVVGPLAYDASMYLSSYAAATGAWAPSILEAFGAANVNGSTVYAQGVGLVGKSNETEVERALELVHGAQAVVLAVGITREVEREALDRGNTTLPDVQEAFAQRVLAAASGCPVVVLLVNGGILSIDQLLAAEHSSSRVAIIEAFNPAQQGPYALAALAFGKENRWGKLPVTIYPASYAATRSMDDMSFVNRSYRYYTGQPLFPFGHGLSLTTFSLHGCSCARVAGRIEGFSCRCSLTNTGKSLAGDEVVLVYHAVGDEIRAAASQSHPVPIRRLVDFRRVSLDAGASTAVAFEVAVGSLGLTTADGSTKVYSGMHKLIFSRGGEDEKEVAVQMSRTSRQHLMFSVPFSGCGKKGVADWEAILRPIHRKLHGTEHSPIVPGAHLLFNVLNCDDATLVNQTHGLLEAAVETRVPVFLGWDPQVWWDQRPDLWNHWNKSAPGYDPSNRENVEWTSWSEESALKISWLNWGRQIRMPPAQNIHAPRVRAATAHALRVVGRVVGAWWAGANVEDRALLAGIKLGCEASIGWQTWAYPDANLIFDKWPHDDQHDPTYGGNHSAPPEPPTFGHAQIGFAAATTSSLKSAGPLTNHDVQTLTHWYLANLTAAVIEVGVPKSVLFTHYGGTLIPAGASPVAPTMPYSAGELDGVALGVSLYVTPLDQVPAFATATRRREGWGAVEFGLPDATAPAGVAVGSVESWLAGINRTLSLRGCRLLSQLPLTPNATAAANALIRAAGSDS